MIIDLEALSPGTQLLTADEVVAFEDVDGSENRIACHAELTVRKADEAIYIHAILKGVFRTSCHKCLEPAEYLVEPSFDLVVKRTASASAIRPAGDDDDLIYVAAKDREISLDQQVYENLIASMPMRILCRDDCQGLCAGCGANLNIEPCRCERERGVNQEPLRKPGDTKRE
jgi:uncharacterized protein